MTEVQITVKIAELALVIGVLDTFKKLAPRPVDVLDKGAAIRLDEIREKFYQKILEGT